MRYVNDDKIIINNLIVGRSFITYMMYYVYYCSLCFRFVHSLSRWSD